MPSDPNLNPATRPRIIPDRRLAELLCRRLAAQGAHVSESDANEAMIWAANRTPVMIGFSTTLHTEAVRLWNDREQAMAEIRDDDGDEEPQTPVDGEVSHLRDLVQNLETKLRELSAQNDTLYSANQRYRNRVAALEFDQTRLGRLMSQRTEASARIAELETALHVREVEVGQLRQTRDRIRKQRDDMTARNKGLEARISYLEKIYDPSATEAETANINRRLAALAHETKTKSEHIADLDASNVRLRAERDRLRTAVREAVDMLKIVGGS